MAELNRPVFEDLLSDETIRCNLRRLRRERGMKDGRIAERFEWATGRPVSVASIRSNWFGTRPEPPQYTWTQIVGLALALDVSVREIVLPRERGQREIDEAARLFGLPVPDDNGDDAGDAPDNGDDALPADPAEWLALLGAGSDERRGCRGRS